MKSTGTVRTNYLDWASLVIVVVGAVNWGLVGIGHFIDANWNLVNLLFGSVPALEATVYLLVGLAGLYEIYFGYQLYAARRMEPESREKPAA